ncbi:MAG: hypothetical protein K0Q79_2378 [Flavipsychrobacter sp.]|jgi:hypothetical protein|nr:hypothetical protein [Flavipsychrobacter sp.]
MKYLASLLLISVVAFASCRKSYKCTCATTRSTGVTTSVYNFDKSTEREAVNKCNLYEQQQNNALTNASTSCGL